MRPRRPRRPAPTGSSARAAVLAAVAALAGLALGCRDDGAGLGASCDGHGDCAGSLQCLEGLCTPACEAHVECGDGRRCDDGRCEEVDAEPGDACAREIDCGAGQACALTAADGDGDGRIDATCALTSGGAVVGEPCGADVDCRSGTCALGRCVELCAAPGDCPPATTCAELPRRLPSGVPARFGACLQDGGVLAHVVAVDEIDPALDVAVPSTARSFALVASVDEPGVTIGVAELRAPDGALLHRSSGTPEAEQFFANPIRHTAALGTSTLLVPNTTRVALETGLYRVELAARFAQGSPAPSVPRVTVLYKLDDAATLDLHFVFLDLAEHPCREAWGGGRLDAARATALPEWTAHVERLREVFGEAGVALGQVTYRDLDERADLDAVDQARVDELFAQATAPTGVTVFVVRSIAPGGVQALAGHPAPPRTPGAEGGGVVVSADALCYRSWPSFTRITAHALGTAMGLFRNREPDAESHLDPIDDSDGSSDNLMYFGEFGGLELSAGQAAVLRRYPGLR